MTKEEKINYINDFLSKKEEDIKTEDAATYIEYVKDLAKHSGFYSELLAREYFEGKYLKKNIKLVLKYFEKAYQLRNYAVVMPLANMYKNGLGCPVNNEKAFGLYISEYLKDTDYKIDCALELYDFYYNGIFVDQDLPAAKALMANVLTPANIGESFEGIHLFYKVAYHYAFVTYRMANSFMELYDALKYALIAKTLVKKSDEFYSDFVNDLDNLLPNIYEELEVTSYQKNNIDSDFISVDELEMEAIINCLGEHVSLINAKKLDKDTVLLRFNGTNLYESIPLINFVGKVTYMDILIKGVDLKEEYFNEGQGYYKHAYKAKFMKKENCFFLGDDNDLSVKVDLNIKDKLSISIGEIVSDNKNNGKFKRIKNKHYLDNELDDMLNSFLDDHDQEEKKDDFIEA